MVKKSNDSTTYATRDLAAMKYRAEQYDFDKCLYVVAYEQNLHFKQIFETAKHLGISEKSLNGLEHVAYGMVRLTTGKMSTREGTVVKVDALLQEAIDRVEKVIEDVLIKPPSKIVIEDNLITRKEIKTYATQSRHIVIHDLWLYDTNI